MEDIKAEAERLLRRVGGRVDWVAVDTDGEDDSYAVGTSPGQCDVAQMCWQWDAEFIAAAPRLVRDLLAHVSRLESALQTYGRWQPIETADKNAEVILLTDGVTVDAGGWLSEAAQGAAPGEEFLISPGWWFLHAIDMQPTHWMKLPDPPQTRDTKGEG